MQSSEHDIEWEQINDKASAMALCTKSPDVIGVLIEIGTGGVYDKAQHFKVHVPSERTEENARIFDDAKRMSQRGRAVNPSPRVNMAEPRYK